MRASNPLCRCSKSGAWTTRQAAEEALRRVLDDPDPARAYKPTHVFECPHGVWHLTSKSGKTWRSGKIATKRHRRRNR